VYADDARATAEALETNQPPAARLPLHGLPVGVKDVIQVAGHPVTASSMRLGVDPSTSDAQSWRRLRAAGAIAVGHCHTHEFAAGATTDQCANPWDPLRSPGGSSGGSAVAVATGAVPVALGTDTAGSLRIPAALCGVSTIKPTSGLVSNEGTIPLGASFDTVGPMALHVRDVRRVLEYLAQPAEWARTRSMATSRATAHPGSLHGVRFGMAPGRTDEGSLAVRSATLDTARVLEDAGAVMVLLDLPGALVDPGLDDAYMSLLLTDIWQFHQTLRDAPGHYGADVAELVGNAEVGALSPDAYRTGQLGRRAAARVWDRFLDEHDLDFVLEPTCPVTAPPRVAPGSVNPSGLSLARLTTLWNHIGNPVVAIPATRTPGLPVGVSLVGRRHDDLRLLLLAELLQDILPPPVWSTS
jgi:aspartyl-tRNA(Asn)/glutamyl-tRNA(Gln) amidotransferase subunit A